MDNPAKFVEDNYSFTLLVFVHLFSIISFLRRGVDTGILCVVILIGLCDQFNLLSNRSAFGNSHIILFKGSFIQITAISTAAIKASSHGLAWLKIRPKFCVCDLPATIVIENHSIKLVAFVQLLFIESLCGFEVDTGILSIVLSIGLCDQFNFRNISSLLQNLSQGAGLGFRVGLGLGFRVRFRVHIMFGVHSVLGHEHTGELTIKPVRELVVCVLSSVVGVRVGLFDPFGYFDKSFATLQELTCVRVILAILC